MEEEEEVEDAYKVRVLRWGESNEENLDIFGIHTNPFHLNMTAELLEKSNHASLLYVCDSTALSTSSSGKPAHTIHHNVLVPILQELKGYARFFVFDCAHPDVKKMRKDKHPTYEQFLAQTCKKDNKDRNPLLGIYKLPALRKNPYTGETMKTEYSPYREQNISPQLFKKYVTNQLQDFTSKVQTENDFNVYVKNAQDKDINKVLIFTKREKVAPTIKALSAEFRDTIRFSVISIPEGKGTDFQKELLKDYEIEGMPKLVLEQTYDAESESVLAQYRIHDYKEKEFKIDQLLSFLRPFARKVAKEEPEDVSESKEQQTSDAEDKVVGNKYEELTDGSFKKSILASNEAHMVYFTTLGKNDAVESEFKYFNKLIRSFRGVVTFSVFRMDPTSANFAAQSKKYRVSSVAKGKPKMRYYPNQAIGDIKMSRSYEIFFDRQSKDFELIENEVKDNYVHEVNDILPQTFNNFIVRHAKDEQKHVVYYMYRQDQDVSLDFKAVSQHPLFADDCVFLSMRDPSVEIFQGLDTRLLPIIGVVQKLGPEFQDGHIQQTHVSGGLKYEQLMGTIAEQAGKREEYLESKHESSATKKSKVERNFGEITSLEDFEARCISYKKGCGIALIPALQNQEYERDNFNDYIDTLVELDASAKTSSTPIFYSWINVTCHPEVLGYFEVDQFQIPTVVFNYPQKELQANLIGKFSADTISDHEQRFIKGRLATRTPKQKYTDFQIEEKDC